MVFYKLADASTFYEHEHADVDKADFLGLQFTQAKCKWDLNVVMRG